MGALTLETLLSDLGDAAKSQVVTSVLGSESVQQEIAQAGEKAAVTSAGESFFEFWQKNKKIITIVGVSIPVLLGFMVFMGIRK